MPSPSDDPVVDPIAGQPAIPEVAFKELLAERRYAIGAQVARGGMGAILEARQSAMDRRVAMKVMLNAAEPADAARFIDEAKITGQLEHPNIVPVHELGLDEEGQLFYAMKFVRGLTLKKVIESLTRSEPEAMKKYPLPALLTVFQKACDAVAFAHSKGVIHRDLKPENLMLGDFGEVLVMDWGLAKVIGTRHVEAPARARSSVPCGARAPAIRWPAPSWARPPTWRPSRRAAKSIPWTTAGTSTPSARFSFTSSRCARR